jgi:hypothetical protein
LSHYSENYTEQIRLFIGLRLDEKHTRRVALIFNTGVLQLSSPNIQADNVSRWHVLDSLTLQLMTSLNFSRHADLSPIT